VNLPEVDSENYDLIILGAGPAGMVCADYAASLGKRVLILDSSERNIFLLDEWGSSNASSRMVAGGLGGQSNVWGAQIVYPEFAFLKKLKKLIAADNFWVNELISDLDYLIKKLQLPIDVGNKYYADELFLKDFFETKYSIYLKKNNLSYYFSRLIEYVDYIDNTEVNSITVEGDGHTFISTNNGGLHIPPKVKVILALGAVETTILLKKSNIRTQIALGNNLQDHPEGVILTVRGKHIPNIRNGPLRKFGGATLKRKFEVSSDNGKQQGVVEFHYNLKGDVDKSKWFGALSLTRLFGFYVNAICLKLLGKLLLPVSSIHIWLQIQQAANPKNHISVDSNGPRISWGLSDEDRDFIFEVHDKLLPEFLKLGMDVLFSLRSCHNIDNQFRPAFHPSGTVPSHQNPKFGFVDAYGRIHNLQNYAIASAATLPIASWYNPTLLIMAIARLTCRKLISN
jgi:hypothetical protein